MRIIILSDTHDNMIVVNELIKVIEREKPNYVFHLGDIISPFVIKTLNRSESRIIGVFGNNEGDKTTILEFADPQIISFEEQPRIIELEGVRFLLFHGFRTKQMTRIIIYSVARTGEFKYILYGHTHELDIKVFNDSIIRDLTEQLREEGKIELPKFETLVINPGEAGGWLTGESTYLILDTNKRTLELRKFGFEC